MIAFFLNANADSVIANFSRATDDYIDPEAAFMLGNYFMNVRTSFILASGEYSRFVLGSGIRPLNLEEASK